MTYDATQRAFVAHELDYPFFKDAKMIEADMYVAYRK